MSSCDFSLAEASPSCDLKHVYCSDAAEDDDFDSLKLMIELGCPWFDPNGNIYKKYDGWCAEVAVTTSIHGKPKPYNVEMMLYCFSHGCKLENTLCCPLARAGDIKMLQWALDQGLTFPYDILKDAILSGSQTMIDFVINKGCRYTNESISAAIKENRIDLLMYLLNEKKLQPTMYDANTCVETNNLEFLKILRSFDCDWDEDIYKIAVKKQNLDVIRYAYEHGLVMDNYHKASLIESTIKTGNLKMIEWFHKIDPLRTSIDFNFGHYVDHIELAISRGHLHVVKWALTKGIIKKSPKWPRVSIKYGRLSILQYFVDIGCELDKSEDLCYLALEGNSVEVLKYLLLLGYKVDLPKCLKKISCTYDKSLEVYMFLLSLCPRNEFNKLLSEQNLDWIVEEINLDEPRYRLFLHFDVSHSKQMQNLVNRKKLEILRYSKAVKSELGGEMANDLIQYCIIPFF